MSKERIKELFGEMTGEQISELFVYGSKNKDFRDAGSHLSAGSSRWNNVGLFVIQHIESGEYYGLVEYNLDSWGENSSTAYEYGYPIVALTPEQVTVTQYKFQGEPVEINPENDW